MESEFPTALLDGAALPSMRVPPPGPQSRAQAARLASLESPAFGARREARAQASGQEMGPIVYAEALGANVTDVDGNRYVDLTAGFGALLLGHRAEPITAALTAQSHRLWHGLGDVYGSDAKLALLARLAALYPHSDSRVLLGQSGADAVTAALKTAVLATKKPGVLAFTGSYHGLSYGPLSISSFKPSYQRPFAEQLNPHVRLAPFPTEQSPETMADAVLAAVSRVLRSERPAIGAVVIEPMLGRGGCRPAPPGFLRALGELARAHGAVFVVDEIWTGLARAGETFVSVADGADPDLICVGKGLGGGLPLSACLGRDAIMAAWGTAEEEVVHTATFHGSPLACRTGVALLDTLARDGWNERSRLLGDAFRAKLRAALPSEIAPSVHGRGMLVGVTLAGDGAAFRAMRGLLQAGYLVLTGGPSHDTLTLTPPLTIAPALLDAFVETLADLAPSITTPATGVRS
jgi:4-aminobutyrate aminotransferase / (S)-3-amino-2-methylpropionate transaminase / 5-aminovalerate transaminase